VGRKLTLPHLIMFPGQKRYIHKFPPMETAGFYPAEEIGIARRPCEAQSSHAIPAFYVI